jgi:hypothetical protein
LVRKPQARCLIGDGILDSIAPATGEMPVRGQCAVILPKPGRPAAGLLDALERRSWRSTADGAA